MIKIFIFLAGFFSCYMYFQFVLNVHKETDDLHTKVKNLLKNSRQWLDASWEDDEDTLSSFSHACASKTLLDAARTFMTDKDISQIYPHYDKLLQRSNKQYNSARNVLSS